MLLNNEANYSCSVRGQYDLMKSAFENKFLLRGRLSIAGILANKLLEEMNIINYKGIISPQLKLLPFIDASGRLLGTVAGGTLAGHNRLTRRNR